MDQEGRASASVFASEAGSSARRTKRNSRSESNGFSSTSVPPGPVVIRLIKGVQGERL